MRVSQMFGGGAVPEDAAPFSTTVVTQPPARKPEGGMALLGEKAQNKIEMYVGEVKSIARLTTNKALASAEEAHVLNEGLIRAKVALKELEACQKAATDPLNAQLKLIRGVFKPLTESLEAFEVRAKRLILAWTQEERARVEREKEEARRLTEEAARREAEALASAEAAATEQERAAALSLAQQASHDQSEAMVAAPMEAPKALRGDFGTSSTVERWTLLGFTNLDDVPKCYWHDRRVVAVLEKVLREAIRSGIRAIQGCSIGPEETISTRVGQ